MRVYSLDSCLKSLDVTVGIKRDHIIIYMYWYSDSDYDIPTKAYHLNFMKINKRGNTVEILYPEIEAVSMMAVVIPSHKAHPPLVLLTAWEWINKCIAFFPTLDCTGTTLQLGIGTHYFKCPGALYLSLLSTWDTAIHVKWLYYYMKSWSVCPL